MANVSIQFVVTADLTGCSMKVKASGYTTRTITAGQSVTASYAEGTRITLTATMGSGYTFVAFRSIQGNLGTTNPLTFTAASYPPMVALVAVKAGWQDADGNDITSVTKQTGSGFFYVRAIPVQTADTPTVSSSSTSVATVALGTEEDDYRLVKITPKSAGSTNITYSCYYQGQTITITLPVTIATVRTVEIKKGNWGSFRYKIGSGSWSSACTADTTIEVQDGYRLDVDWYSGSNLSGSFCWYMTTAGYYAGDGSDDLIINSNTTVYPAKYSEDNMVEYPSGYFYESSSSSTRVTSVSVARTTYNASTQKTVYYRPYYADTTAESSDTSVATVTVGGSSNSRRIIYIQGVKAGTATIKVIWVSGQYVYYNTLAVTVNPVVRLYKLGWAYFGQYGSTMYSTTYKDYAVALGGSFDAVWYKVSGDKSYPYCENMVETGTYPGGGTDSVSNITSDRAFYPATAMPRTFKVGLATVGGTVTVENRTRGTSQTLTGLSEVVTVEAADGDSIRITATPGTGYALNAIRLGSTLVSSTSPYSFTMDSSYEDKTFNVSFKVVTYDVSISPNTSSYGSVDVTSVTGVPYGSTISASGNVITINGVATRQSTATPTDFTRTYTYEFDHWTVNGTTLASGSSTTVTQATTIKAVFTRRTTTFTESSTAWWAERGGSASSKITSKTMSASDTVQIDVHPGPQLNASPVNGDWTVRVTDSAGNTQTAYATCSAEYGTAYYLIVTLNGRANGSCYVRCDWRTSTGYSYTMLPLNVVKYWDVTTSANTGGTITSSASVAQGSSKTVSWSANSGYYVYSVTIDGAAKSTSLSSWTFSNITANHTVAVQFAKSLSHTLHVWVEEDWEDEDNKLSTSASWTTVPSISGVTFDFYRALLAYVPKITGTPAEGTEGTYRAVAQDSSEILVYTIIVDAASSISILLDRNGGTTHGHATVGMGDTSLSITDSPVWEGHEIIEYRTNGGTKIASVDGTLMPGVSYMGTDFTDAQGHWVRNSTTVLMTAWRILTYTVTFNANGGTCSEASRVVTYGETYGAMPIPTLAGKSFTGWYTEESGGTRILGSDTVGTDAERTLYAHWADATNINLPTGWTEDGYKSDGGTVIDQPLILERNKTKRIYWQSVYDLSNTGQLDRWQSADTSVATVSNVGSSTIYKWSADVRGVSVGTTTVRINWYVEGTDDATYYYSDLQVRVVPTVTFNGNGGTPDVATMAVNANGTLDSLPGASYDVTHTFVGWFTQATGGTQIDSTTVFTADTTVYAHWAVGYTIVYNANGGGGGPGYETSTDSAETHTFTIPDNVPTKPGETFYEWNSKADGTGIGYDPGDPVTVTSAQPSVTLYAQYAEESYEFTVGYNANGGSGAPSSQTYTGSSPTYTAVLSDTIPTRSGYVFSGWSESSTAEWPDYLAGSRIELSPGTTTLYAVWSDEASGTGTVDNVRIFKSLGGAYIDVSDRLAIRSRIHEAENYGATASFTIVNDFSDNLLSASYDGWSDGSTGALSTGMFVQIRDASPTGFCWGTFMIMTLSASDDLVSVTCGDYIQVLRATGAEYYRNIYNGEGLLHGREFGQLVQVGTKTQIEIPRPDGVTFTGGVAGDVRYMAPVEWDLYSGTVKTEQVATNQSGTTDIGIRIYGSAVIPLGGVAGTERQDGVVGMKSITFKFLSKDSYSGTEVVWVSVYRGLEASESELLGSKYQVLNSGGAENDLTVSFGEDYVDLSMESYLYVTFSGIVNDQTISREYSYGYVRCYSTAMSGATFTLNGITTSGQSIVFIADALEYSNASGQNVVEDGVPLFRIEQIGSVDSFDESYISDTWDYGRAWVRYISTEETMPMDQVMSTILAAPEAVLTATSSTREVSIFRCGGDNYHAYMLALADMEDDGGPYDGRQHAFCAATSAWGRVSLGARYRADDMSQMSLYYGGDTAIVGGQVMKSFAPSLTKANRPMIAVSKGATNDNKVIMIAVKDPEVPIGASSTVLGSAATTFVDAAFEAYSQIMTNRSTDWEGTAELSGIHSMYMKRAGTYIGGVPIRISDSRYGMSLYQAKVKECTVDYDNLITTLVLNNYSESYGNAVLDTSKMAYQAGNLACVSDSEELYNRQYVFIETDSALPSGDITMSLVVDGTVSASVTAGVIKYPELGVATVYAYFPNGTSENAYAVSAVRVNSTTFTIPEARRPDYLSGQYLIVNVQMDL